MGYTHYWYRKPELDAETFKLFAGDVKKILKAVQKQGVKLVGPGGTEGSSISVSSVRVRFNGEGPESHESFWIDRVSENRDKGDGTVFEFCKTAWKPYDMAVCAVLLALKHHFGDAVRVLSDGWFISRDRQSVREKGWEDAVRLVSDVLGRTEAWEYDESGIHLTKEPASRA